MSKWFLGFFFMFTNQNETSHERLAELLFNVALSFVAVERSAHAAAAFHIHEVIPQRHTRPGIGTAAVSLCLHYTCFSSPI